MKFTDQEDLADYKKAIGVGAMKGLGVGAVISVGLTALLKRRTSYFTNAGGLQKTLVFVAPSVFTGITFMEGASRSFEDHQRKKQHGIVEHTEKHKSANSFDALSDFFGRNKYKFVTGGWAASLAGSFYVVNRDPYMTKAQKIVQARVYAQGLTVAMLLLTVFLSVGSNKSEADIEKEKKVVASHSWERDIGYVQHANHPKGVYSDEFEQKAAAKKSGNADEDKKTGTDAALQGKKEASGSDAVKGKSAPQDQSASQKNGSSEGTGASQDQDGSQAKSSPPSENSGSKGDKASQD